MMNDIISLSRLGKDADLQGLSGLPEVNLSLFTYIYTFFPYINIFLYFPLDIRELFIMNTLPFLSLLF